MASPLIVNISELLRRPGTKRDMVLVVPASLFAFEDLRVVNESMVDVKLHLESLTDAIVVRGELGAHWQLQCRRCLRPVADASMASVDELYQRIPDNPDAYPLVGEQLDLQPMVRELVLLSLPEAPLCSAECPGLCSQCGADLQSNPCACGVQKVDERWAVLDALRREMGE